jgi:hypothetical protein
MAKIYAMENQKEWEKRKDESYDTYCAREEKLMRELEKKDAARKKGEYVGAIIRTGVADGRAQYVVLSMKPLQLAHIPYGDAYSAGAIWERGLTVADVKRMADRTPFRMLGKK